jgi:hypothetical protein
MMAFFGEVNLMHFGELLQGVCPQNKNILGESPKNSLFAKIFFFKGVLLAFWGSPMCIRFTFLQCFYNVCKKPSFRTIYHSKR